jgi:hypothetical protein
VEADINAVPKGQERHVKHAHWRLDSAIRQNTRITHGPAMKNRFSKFNSPAREVLTTSTRLTIRARNSCRRPA